MMAAMALMAGGMAFAQQPETQEPAKQETPAQPEEQNSEPVKEEAEKDGECKGECTPGESAEASSSLSGTTDTTK